MIQVGIVSWGFKCNHVDGNGLYYPGFQADVTMMVSWIKSTMNEGEDVPVADDQDAPEQ